MTSLRWYLLGLLGLFGAFVALEYYRPRPLDWRPTYLSKDKIPYGTYALFDQLPRLLGTDSVRVVRVAAFNQLTGIASQPTDDDNDNDPAAATQPAPTDSTATETVGEDQTTQKSGAPEAAAEPTSEPAADAARATNTSTTTRDIELRPARANYLFIDSDIQLAAPDARALLRYAAQGHDVFIAAEDFGGRTLTDSLGFRSRAINRGLPRLDSAQAAALDSVSLRFSSPTRRGPAYRLPGDRAAYRLSVAAGRPAPTLATDAQGRAVFVRLSYGRGHFYLCSVPVAFTNYYVLRPATTGFAAGALSYLPPRPAWWDEYEKTGPQGEQSLLRVLLAHDGLRPALYLTLLGGLLLVAVAARRRQRIIPTIRPLPNTTLLFTRTVAGLYRQGRSHDLIAEKKVSLFLDYLRTRFQENTPDFGDEAFRERLAHKAGLPRPRVDELLRLVNFARTAPQVTDAQLLKLSRALSDFRREARR